MKWEKPPTVQRTGRTPDAKYIIIAEQLKENPQEWALIIEQGHQTTAARIRSGRISAFRPKGAFEATARNTDEQGRCQVYARYIGE
jgi:hypothetical protein